MPRKKQKQQSEPEKEFVFYDNDEEAYRYRIKRMLAEVSIKDGQASVVETVKGNFLYRNESEYGSPTYFWAKSLEELVAQMPTSDDVDCNLLKKLGFFEKRVEEI